MYVVTAPKLAQAFQEQPQSLVFSPIEANIAFIVCRTSPIAHAILKMNSNCDDGHLGLSMEASDGIRTMLKLGAWLNKMNCLMSDNVQGPLNILLPGDWSWTTDLAIQLRTVILRQLRILYTV